MAYLLVRHKVADYDRWKAVFDADGARRASEGSRGGQVFRTIGVPDEVIVLLEWSDATALKQFMFNQSEELRHKMDEAGVDKVLELYFLDLAATTDK